MKLVVFLAAMAIGFASSAAESGPVPEKKDVDAEAFALLPADYIRKTGVLPMRIEDKVLLIAVTYVLNIGYLAALRAAVRFPVLIDLQFALDAVLIELKKPGQDQGMTVKLQYRPN